MNYLNKITVLFNSEELSLPEILQSIVNLLPSALQDTKSISARITINDQEYLTENFKKTKFEYTRSFKIPGNCKGIIQVFKHEKELSEENGFFSQQDIETVNSFSEHLKREIQQMNTRMIHLDSEKRYQLMAENSVDAIWIMDPLLNFSYISPSVYQITGFTPEEWIGTNLSKHASRKEFLKMAGEAIKALKNYKEFKYVIFTANMLKKNKEEVPVEIIGKLLLNKNGFPIGLQGSTRDISQRINAEEAMKAAEEKYLNSAIQLYEAGKKIGQSLKLDEIYTNLHTIISNTMTCDGMIVASFNPQTELITCETMWHEDKRIDVSAFPPIPLEPKSKGTQSLVIRSGNSLYLADYQAHQRTSKNSYYVDQEGIAKNQKAPKDELITSSAILVPLKREGQVIGVIQVYSYKLDDFSKDDLQFLEAFSPQISAAITNAALFEETASSKNQLQEAFRGTIDVIAAAVEMRDPYTAGHQRRVSHLAVHIARQLGLHIDQIEGIRMAGFIHDLGKINIPIEILSKPGKLSEMEFALIKTHPQNGYEMLKQIHFPWPIAEIILQHHENMDGSGYPNGQTGDAILLEAKILTIADVVEAMSSDRPYRPALGTACALQEIKDQRGKRYDQELVDACIQIFQDGYQFSD